MDSGWQFVEGEEALVNQLQGEGAGDLETIGLVVVERFPQQRGIEP